MKKLFLDSANPDEIARVIKSSAISGVTTNPSLMAKTSNLGADGTFDYYLSRLDEIFSLMNTSFSRKHLSVEVITSIPTEMLEQAEKIQERFNSNEKLNEKINLFIKIPVMVDTLDVITELEFKKIKVNATACAMADQAFLAQKANASTVSFFYNRIKDGGGDPDEELRRFCHLTPPFDAFTNFDGSVETLNKSFIICGSIRKPQDVHRAWENGANAVTVPMKILELLMKHPQTDKAVQSFQEDIDRWLGKE